MSNPWPLLMLALFACGAPSEADPEDETDTDTDSDSDSDADTDTDTDSDTDADVPEPDWTGNWRIAMEWSYECDMGFGNMRTESGDDSWALAFSGPPTALEVEVNQNYNYTLTGTGDADGVQLCGTFPVPDVSGDDAPTLENAICILADVVVDAKTVTGIATGHFDGSYGEACEMFDSPITLTK